MGEVSTSPNEIYDNESFSNRSRQVTVALKFIFWFFALIKYDLILLLEGFLDFCVLLELGSGTPVRMPPLENTGCSRIKTCLQRSRRHPYDRP